MPDDNRRRPLSGARSAAGMCKVGASRARRARAARPAGLRAGTSSQVRRSLGGKLAHSLSELRPIAAAHPL